MKKKLYIRKALVFFFKVFIHLITYAIFIKGFSTHYLGLRFLSRTLAVSTASFFVFTGWLTSVYGKIDVGYKKSRPLFHTLALNVLITDVLTFIALRVMTYHDHFSLLSDLLMLGLVYVIQLIVGRILIFNANKLYFVNYIPEKTLVIQHNSNHLDKVLHYLKRHKKQYAVIDVLHNPKIEDVSLENIKNLFILGENHDFMHDLILKSMFLDLNIFYESNIQYVALSQKESFVVDDVLMFHYKTQTITLAQSMMKRTIDILFASIGFIVASPFMLLVALMIKLDDGGPIIFSQERLTQNGRIFKIYKFRSMKLNSGDIPASKDDDRITRSGKLIRKLRLDELPQLLNILKGDMSIVGPRPESVVITHQILETVPEFGFRLKVKAGLTGTAQILGKYNTLPKDKLLFDLYYIENFTILNDLKLMFQTLVVFVKKDSTEGFDKQAE